MPGRYTNEENGFDAMAATDFDAARPVNPPFRPVGIAGWLALLWLAGPGIALTETAETGKSSEAPGTAELRKRIAASPELPFKGTYFAAQAPTAGWESGRVSWVAIDAQGRIYELQRGVNAAPVLVLDRDGKILRSWGTGEYKIPHSIRIDPSGNVWTVDAGSSMIIKYSPAGKKLLTISVGQQPADGGPFSGATDIAFGRNGHLFVSDGYGNARVLEYAADGRRLKQWGRPGSGPGEFHLPHSIQVDDEGIVYVADRENGRIEKFDLDGRYLGEIGNLGRVYSLKLADGVLWAGIQPMDAPPGSAGWMVELDPKTGKLLGHLDVSDPLPLHCVELSAAGEPVTVQGTRLLWFRRAQQTATSALVPRQGPQVNDGKAR